MLHEMNREGVWYQGNLDLLCEDWLQSQQQRRPTPLPGKCSGAGSIPPLFLELFVVSSEDESTGKEFTVFPSFGKQ